jgi:hypothetical protein
MSNEEEKIVNNEEDFKICPTSEIFRPLQWHNRVGIQVPNLSSFLMVQISPDDNGSECLDSGW